MNETTTNLPRTGLTLRDARDRLSGLHFAKESLTQNERDILYIAEGLLRLIDETNDPNTASAPAPTPSTPATPTPARPVIDFNDDTETPLVHAARAKVFHNGRCRICAHLEGDHESLGDGRFTCDDACDEDINGYCHPDRV